MSGHWGRWCSSGILFHRIFGLADYGICRFHLNIIHLCTPVHAQPFMLKFLSRKKDSPKSGVEALIGRTAIVEEDIVPETNSGRVAIDGDRWKAVSEDGNNIMKGEKVVVLKVDSIILTVRKA